MSGDIRRAQQIAVWRLVMLISVAMTVAGGGLTTFGLSQRGKVTIFLIGVVFATVGYIADMHAKNAVGGIWTIGFRVKLGKLGFHKTILQAALVDSGVPSEEVQSLHSMAHELYGLELEGLRMREWLNIGRPIVNAMAIALYGDWWLALAVVVLGLSYTPVGKIAQKAEARRQAKIQAGTSAHHIDFLHRLYEERVLMTDMLNGISMLPKAAFALKYLINAGNLLAAMNGLTDGLSGLTSCLTFQKLKVTNARATATTERLISILGNEPFITPQTWATHTAGKQPAIEVPPHVQSGLVVKNFRGKLPSNRHARLPALNFSLASGEAIVLQAPSGTGKSMTLLGLMHLLENSGDEYIVHDSQAINVHSLSSAQELTNYMLFISEEGVEHTARIVDLFKAYFREQHPELYAEHLARHPQMLVEVAWAMADNLLDVSIARLEHTSQHAANEQPAFPASMLPDLCRLNQVRTTWVDSILQAQHGNMASRDVHAKRMFASLSAGERRRLLVTVAAASHRPIVIFDEPLAHLDDHNRALQLEQLRQLQAGDQARGEQPVALLIVAHEHVQQLHDKLQAQLINLS